MVAIIGLPNAGKSSLLNHLIETKLSIVTAAAQTTREQVVGIDTRNGVQMIFIDTPGIVDPAYLLHRSMLQIVASTIADADVVVLLLDGTRPPPAFPDEIEDLIRGETGKLIVAINKADVASGETVARLARWAEDRFGRAPLELSARNGKGVAALRTAIADRLPDSPFLYPDEDISTQNLRFFVSELIRETIFERYEDEIPYASAVRVEEFREESRPIFIRALIFVERASQKGILIGRAGAAIRDLGAASRAKIEAFLESPVYLDLWVKVLPRWRKSPLELQRLGFPVPEDSEEK
jgi:GTP-binding protein Era